MDDQDLVGIDEIAEQAGVTTHAVRQWISRTHRGAVSRPPFPDAELWVSGTRIWRWNTVRDWLETTDRLPGPTWRSIPLRPQHPGEWLAGVGLTQYGMGRWSGPVEQQIPTWWYRFAGTLPTVDELVEVMDDIAHRRVTPSDPDRPDKWSAWFNHRGTGNPRRTASKLRGALDKLGSGPIEISDRRTWSRTTAGNGWEIDDTWLAPPGAYDAAAGASDPGRPTVIAALALLGAHIAADWPGHWPRRRIALGHLWGSEGPDVHRLDGWYIVWRRRKRHGVPTAGPLGYSQDIRRLSPPSWKQQVISHIDPEPHDLIALSEITKLHRLSGAERQTVIEAARAGNETVIRDIRIPPPLLVLDGSDQKLVWSRYAIPHADNADPQS